jgi:serine protease Do
MTRFVRALTLAAALAASGCASLAQAQQQSASQPIIAPPSFAPLVKRVVPAVVNIAVTESVPADSQSLSQIPPELKGTPFERQFRDRMKNRREQVLGAGSGFVIDPSGIIVTNNHVVGHADRIIVSTPTGAEMPARLLGSDDLTDIAVIKVDAPQPLPYVTWGDSHDVQVGDWVLAAGNPFGLGSSVTAGIVSARGRDIGAGPFDDFLQIDAPINPGNSGGPTFNMSGQVIAVNTAIVSPTGGSVGIGFAIPAEIASGIVAQLRDKGHIDRGWLGVSVQDTKASANGQSNGVPVAGVDRTGPAAHAGLRTGDLILAINGEHVDTARGLIRAVAATPPGNHIRLTIRRQGQTMEVPVTVGRRPPESAG